MITLWLRQAGRPIWYTLLPMLFMVSSTMVSLVQLTWQHGLSLLGGVSAGLLGLAAVLLTEAGWALYAMRPGPSR